MDCLQIRITRCIVIGRLSKQQQAIRRGHQSRTQSNACARARMALALGKLNFSCAVIGLTFINRTCRQRTGTPKFRGSGCQFPQSQCHPSPRTGIALGTRLRGHSLTPQTFALLPEMACCCFESRPMTMQRVIRICC